MKKYLLLLLAVCLLAAGCGVTETSSLEESTASSEEESVAVEDSSEEESLPEKQILVILYEYYLTAGVESEGIFYEYTYCFDEEGRVFNALAKLTYPSPEKAETEYYQLIRAEYPNVELEGNVLSFAFPKKKCPYFGITYTALPYLLEESVYTVTDFLFPEENESSDEE
jgi:ABC-type Fe3+-hydroxamate transport system substrate-binding protein